MSLAVVLGGGGSAAVAWETGVLAALADEGVDLAGADLLVGTSAGTIVAVRLRAGAPLPQQYATALEPADAQPMVDFAALSARWAQSVIGATSAIEARQRIGRLALDADTMPPTRRRAQLAALLPTTRWPQREVAVVAVSALTGRTRVFTAADDVALVDAVAASCAVPGVWPPVDLDGDTYVDGAVRSNVNASVAAGHERVVVLAPFAPAASGGIDRELASLGPDVLCQVVGADAAALTAFGPNPLDAAVAPAAAREGYRQGRAAASAVDRLVASG